MKDHQHADFENRKFIHNNNNKKSLFDETALKTHLSYSLRQSRELWKFIAENAPDTNWGRAVPYSLRDDPKFIQMSVEAQPTAWISLDNWGIHRKNQMFWLQWSGSAVPVEEIPNYFIKNEEFMEQMKWLHRYEESVLRKLESTATFVEDLRNNLASVRGNLPEGVQKNPHIPKEDSADKFLEWFKNLPEDVQKDQHIRKDRVVFVTKNLRPILFIFCFVL